jgi:hypothetical protein
LEVLEGRELLTTFSWYNSNDSGNFNVASNWVSDTNPSFNAVPGPGDTIDIPQGDFTITITQNETVNSIQGFFGGGVTVASGATLTVDNSAVQLSSTIDALTVQSGASFVAAGGTTTLENGGEINGNLTAAAGATLIFSDSASFPGALETGTTLTGTGTFEVASYLFIDTAITAPTNLELASGNSDGIDGTGTLTFPSGSTLNWQSGSMQGLGGVTDIESGASVLIDGPSTTPFYLIDRTLNNAGSIIYSSTASLNFEGQATLNNSGAFAITADNTISTDGGTINNTGSITKTSPSGVGTTLISPTFNNSGTVTATSGILDFNGNGIDTGEFNDPTTAGSIELNGSNGYDLNAGATFTGAGTLELDSGNGVTINSSLTFPNLTVDFGTIEGAGSIYVTGTLSTNAASFENTGSLNLSSVATLTISGANDTTTFVNLTVNDAGTTTLSGTDSFALAGTAVFNNSGKFTIQNDTVSNNGGSFNLNGATFNNTGSLIKTTPSGPSGLSDISGGIFYNSGTVSAVSGQLQLDVQGTNTGDLDSEANATLLLTTLMNLNAGSTLTGPGLIENGNGTTTGTGNINVNANVSANRLKFINQTLTVSPGDTFTITTFNFAGGTVQGTGTLAIPAGGLIGFTGASSMSITGTTLAVAGTATWTGTGSINLASGAVISVKAGATFSDSSDETINGGSGGTLNVYGTFNKTSLTGVGTTTIGVPTNILPGGTIALLTGNVSTQSLINVGKINLGSQTVLTVNGTYTQPNAGTLSVAVGGTPASALYGKIVVSSTASINGTLSVTPANGYIAVATPHPYPIITASSLTGVFTTVSLPNNGLGSYFQTSETSTAYDLAGMAIAPTAPTGLSIYPADDTSGPGKTSNLQPRLTGTAQANILIQIFAVVNGSYTYVGAGYTNASGVFVITPANKFAIGTYTLEAVAVDTYSHYSPNSSYFTLNIT